MYKYPIILSFVVALISNAGIAQIDCKTVDINKIPGTWVWKKGGYGTQYQQCEPIRKEIQRIMPVALDGLHATNGIAYGDLPTIANTNAAPKTYECYLMLKKYECLKGYNVIQPEAVTGCWVYFVVNGIFQGGSSFEDGLHFPYYKNESLLLVGNFYTEKDATGNRILYVSTFGKANQIRGYYFSAKERLPLRKITWRELISSYKTYTEKQLNHSLTYIREGLAKNEKELTTTLYEDTKKYLTNLITDRKREIEKLENEIKSLQTWYDGIVTHQKLDEVARSAQIRLEKKEIEEIINRTDTTNTYPVWIEDLSFYDLTKPKDQPQCVFFSFRRQDDDLPKKNFMDLFVSQFNMDVLCKWAGETPKLQGAINNVNASRSEAKTETKLNQQNTSSYTYDFKHTPVDQFPEDWNGIKNIKVQKYENEHWLALTQDGYWYPKQYNKEIKDQFQLSFDLSWNKEIAYNSGLFTISFSEVEYNNPSQKYRVEDEPAKFWSFYDSYVGNFNRVMIWFDPYWNSGGALEVYSYNKEEKIIASKRVLLAEFYTSKNSHQVKITRKGNTLLVFINGKMEAEIDNVFIPSARYNLYTFSRYKGKNSDNKNDVFYLNDLKVSYDK